MIDANAELVVVLIQRFGGAEAVRAERGRVRQRKKWQQVLRNRVDERNLVVQERLPRKFVDELILRVVAQPGGKTFRTELCEISPALGLGRNRGARRFALPVTQSLVIKEEERLVFLDR